jgi:glycosyltransferase involved in cell wall biosynthesis
LTSPSLSIVIPTYNEEPRIAGTLEKVVRFLEAQSYGWEVVVVDDGSTDGTAALVEERAKAEARIRLERRPHAGKGWTVRHGMLAAKGRLRMLCDADLAMPIEFLPRFLAKIDEGHDVAIGSREAHGARRFGEPAGRHLIGRAFNWCVRLLAVRQFQDTQCGFKCFRAGAAETLFPLQRTKGFGFDVEVLYLAVRKKMQVAEVPIDWHHQPRSKVRPMVDSFIMLRDMVAVRLNGLLGRYGG